MGGGFFFRIPCVSLLKVAALTPPGWEVTIIDEKVEPLDLNLEADLVGITSMTTTVQRGYELGDHFRKRGIKVVMGGMHASALPEEAIAHCDSVVIGEAENLWQALIADFESDQLKRIYRHDQQFPCLGESPLPDWSLIRGKNYLPVHLVETTRGCPIDCEFCAVSTAFGGRYRNRPLEEVMLELRGLKPFDGLLTLKNCVFFVDDNIVSNRTYAREMLTRLAEHKFRWFGQASMNIARDPEILRLCQQSGCVGLFIGFESLSPETLAAVGKRVNRPDEYLEIVQRVHDHGIGIDGSFVFENADRPSPEKVDTIISKVRVYYHRRNSHEHDQKNLYERVQTGSASAARDQRQERRPDRTGSGSWPRLSFPLEIQVLSGGPLSFSRARSGQAGAGAAPAIGA